MESPREVRSLETYKLGDIHETGREIGRGSYATVVELDYKGLRCVGKKIHPVLYLGQETIHLKRFEEECRLLSRLSNPHIVQFLGVYFDLHAPVLVMEYLPTTLAQSLDKYGVLANEISFSILRDVTVSLRYLHERDEPIIHRDLSANNVLLTADMRAKISDLGVAKILQMSPVQQQTMSKTPGTSCYMPPEAMSDKPRYDVKMDTFSFGVMMVHALSGQWPLPSGAVRTNPDNPHHLIAVSEFDRRQSTIKLIQEDHPLMSLIKCCLRNNPSLRPTASEIHQQVNKSAESYPPSFVNKAVMLETIKVLRNEKETIMTEMEETKVKLDAVVKERDRALSENATLTSELEKIGGEMSGLKESNDLLRVNLQDKEKEIADKSEELITQKALLTSRIGSLRNQLDSTSSEKELDIFTSNSKFLCTKLSSFDLQVNAPLLFYTKALCIRDDAYVVYTHVQVNFNAPTTDFAFLHYSCETDTWRSLPLPPMKECNLGHLFGRLLLIGGYKTSDIYEFDEASQTWVMSTSIPPTPTARSFATVATWITPDVSALIVCGGRDHKFNTLTIVEVYHSVTNQWYTAPSTLWLPRPRFYMRHIIMQDTLYLMAGEKLTVKGDVFFINIPNLLESCLQQQQESDQAVSPTKWQTLPNIPCLGCFPVCLGGHLLAIDPIKTTVLIYNFAFSSWFKLGKLPFANVMQLFVDYFYVLPIGSDSTEILVIECKLQSARRVYFTVPSTKHTVQFTAHRVRITH